MKRVFISDCEGPISKNDNAFELTASFVPNGDRLFSLISKYDDVLADILKKPGYNPGDTLKLVLPFLKAFDVTDKQMRVFSAKNLVLIADSKESLKYIRNRSDAFIVSTSYEHYIQALSEALEFPFENTFCTRVALDKYDISEGERLELKEIAKEISQKPMITVPDSARSMLDFSEQDRETVRELDKVFWNDIMSMNVGRIFADVTPVGGKQKAEAVKAAVERARMELADVAYVGDSITDVEAFKLVRESGGLTVSFNGNSYAVKNADVAVQSESNLVTAAIADLFFKSEKKQTIKALGSWNYETLNKNKVDEALLKQLCTIDHGTLPKVQIVSAKNMESIIKESSEFRKKVRGLEVGRLG